MNTTTHTPGPVLEAYAIATAGEQAHEFARDQLAKFRPGGANYRRLRALQDAGEFLDKNAQRVIDCTSALAAFPDPAKDVPELVAALRELWGYVEDLRESNPGYLRKLCLQDYGRLNRALSLAPKILARLTADLIAAAPALAAEVLRLREALRDIADLCGDFPPGQLTLANRALETIAELARAHIAKATGLETVPPAQPLRETETGTRGFLAPAHPHTD